MTQYQAIIVGAGPAGIAAACRLLAKGVNQILLLEAEDRIGGRIHTVPFGKYLPIQILSVLIPKCFK